MTKRMTLVSLAYTFIAVFAASSVAHAVEVKGIQLTNEDYCFSKIQLTFKNQTLSDMADMSPQADHRIFSQIKGNQEVCDDDGGFTVFLIFRAIQDFAQHYSQSDLNSSEMKEWRVIQHSFFAAIEKFAAKGSTYQPPVGAEAVRELVKIKTELESLGEALPKFSHFVKLGEILEQFFAGPYPRLGLSYIAQPRYPDPAPLVKFGIMDSQFTLPLKSRTMSPEPKYVGDFETVFQSFEAEAQVLRGVMPSSVVVGKDVVVSTTYRRASDGQLVGKDFTTAIPESKDGELSVSEPQMVKTYALIGLANAMRDAIQIKAVDPKKAATQLKIRTLELNSFALEHQDITRTWKGHKTWDEMVSLAIKLAENLEANRSSLASDEYSGQTFATRGGGGTRGFSTRSLPDPAAFAAPSFNISSGGAQSAGKAWDMIQQGEVPTLKDFNIGGLLKEFDLSLPELKCQEGEICFGSGVALDPTRGKLWVQMNMGIQPTTEQLRRKPLNVSILVDISGSMSAQEKDSTTRIQWAQSALARLFAEHLQPGDYVSVYKFDHEVEPFLATTQLSNEKKQEILSGQFKAFEPRGATNLEKALTVGFDSVRAKQAELGVGQTAYQNAVILISDAQANMGETEGPALKNQVQGAAADQIGLIAIGIGSGNGYDTGFHQGLIDTITQSRGGSYDFATSQKDMDRALGKIPYLLSPIAYQLNALLKIEGARLFRIYGTAADENSVPKNTQLVSIPTLVLTPSEQGGGATIVEYDIPKFRKATSIENSCQGPFCSLVFKVIGADQQERTFKEGQDVMVQISTQSKPMKAKIKSFTDKQLTLIISEFPSPSLMRQKGAELILSEDNPAQLDILRSLKPSVF